jgi:hypothetical protein
MRQLALFLFAAAVPALAHHSFAAEFDASKPVKIEGVVTKLEWMNPHAWLYLETINAQGVAEHWQFEFGAPVELVRRGWHRQDLKEGDKVTVEGSMAKYKAFTANAQSIILASGKRVFSGQGERTAEK